MQLDFHPVEKVHFNTFAQAFAPKMMEIGLPRLRMNAALSNIYPELFPASPGAQLQEISVSTSSIQLGYKPRSDRKNVVFDPIGGCNLT